MSDISNIEKSLVHRLDLVESAGKELKEKYTGIDENINKNKVKFNEEIKLIREEVNEISCDVDRLIKVIFNDGKILKDKASKKEFEFLQELVDNWKLEEFIHRNELESSFKHYSK